MGRLGSRTTILPGFDTGDGRLLILKGRLESRTTILPGLTPATEGFDFNCYSDTGTLPALSPTTCKYMKGCTVVLFMGIK